MRAIFVARGPAFPHQPHSRMEAFDNLNVYNIICDSLHLDPVPNNGTIRLPLKATGLHSDPDAPKLEAPVDYPNEGIGPPHSVELPTSPTPPTEPSQPSTPTPPSPPSSPSPVADKDEEKKNKKKPSIWSWFEENFEELKDKIESFFGDKKESSSSD
jgi:hypothetical protein